MTENSDERRASKLLVVVAIYVIVDLLALVPALVFTLRSPELAWFAMGPYLFLTAAGLAAILYLALRWGLLEFRGPHMSGMGWYLATVGLLTAAFIVVILLYKGSSIIVLALAAYLAGIFYASFRLLKWQSENLALECQVCGATFRLSLGRWTLSPNMGSRKGVTCPTCSKYTWARVVSRPAGAE